MLLSDISEHIRSTPLNILDNELAFLKCSLILFSLHEHFHNDTIAIIFNYSSSEGYDGKIINK